MSQSWIFSIITHISDYYQCWKQSCCFIFLCKSWFSIIFFRILWWKSSKEQHLFEVEIFCDIINVFPVTFNQFNACLMNKSIHLFSKGDLTMSFINVLSLHDLIWILTFVGNKLKSCLSIHCSKKIRFSMEKMHCCTLYEELKVPL